MADYELPDIPENFRGLRACLVCGLVKHARNFQLCENCRPVLKQDWSYDDCTSSEFDGVMAILQPEKSWVAKWHRCDAYAPGLYAMRVTGQVPDEVVAKLERKGITFRPRDGTAQD
ncbi:transcription elongation factor spt4 [Nowakowskiella sp. JEL0407]|nr:transcription elongation factor spt4 [Nowakowskiella sp. JEL0407]